MHTNAGEPTIQIKYLPSLSTRHCSTRESVPHSGMILYLVVQNHHHFSFNWHSIELIQSRSQEMRLLKRFVCAFLRNGIGTTLLYYAAFFSVNTHLPGPFFAFQFSWCIRNGMMDWWHHYCNEMNVIRAIFCFKSFETIFCCSFFFVVASDRIERVAPYDWLFSISFHCYSFLECFRSLHYVSSTMKQAHCARATLSLKSYFPLDGVFHFRSNEMY